MLPILWLWDYVDDVVLTGTKWSLFQLMWHDWRAGFLRESVPFVRVFITCILHVYYICNRKDDRCDCCSDTAMLSHVNTAVSSERRNFHKKVSAGNCSIVSRTDSQWANSLTRESTFLQCRALQQAARLQYLDFNAFTQQDGAKFCRLPLLTIAVRVFRRQFLNDPPASHHKQTSSTAT